MARHFATEPSADQPDGASLDHRFPLVLASLAWVAMVALLVWSSRAAWATDVRSAPSSALQAAGDPAPEPAQEAAASQASPAGEAERATEGAPDLRHELAGSATETLQAGGLLADLTQALSAFEGRGWDVAFVLRDIATGNELYYNDDEVFYPASSMKAARVCALYQERVEKGETSLDALEGRAQRTIVESDNDAYSSLRESYGGEAFARWLEGLDVGYGTYGSYHDMALWNYPHVSARQFARMWEGVNAYLLTDTEPARQLRGFFEQRGVSPLRDAVGEDIRTWGKAGWFDTREEFGSEPATAEGAVVFAPGGAYIVVVMSNAPAQLDELVPIFAALDRAHTAMAA